MNPARHSFYFLLLVVIAGDSGLVSGQPLLKKLQQQNSKINPAIGFRAGEPMGINIQFYKGIMDTNEKSKGLFDINMATEGAVSSLKQPYKTGTWMPGGIRVSVSWFHEMNHKLFGHFLYYGIGVQAGSRKYQRLANHFTENFAWGPLFTFHGELPVKSFIIRPHALYCKFSIFAEVVYHHEVGDDFNYVRPAGGVRFNWFY